MIDLQKDFGLDEDAMLNRYLTFILDNETYGIEIRYIMEIISVQPVTPLPEMPGCIKGIINLRGRIIPIMDVRLRLNKKAKDYDDRTCIIVTDYKGIKVGLVVDSVSEVLTISKEDISDSPMISKNENSSYVSSLGRIENMVILLLDCGKLISSGELEGLCTAIK